jgi:fibronectin-binding autotransporter adhesin
VTNNGTLEFDSDSSQTFLGYTSGTGVLAKSGAGTLTLSGQHLSTGGVLINEGSLLYIDGEFPSEIAGHVTNNTNSHFNKTTNTSFFNSISGTGSVTKSGSETLRLLGATTYTGATTVNAGSLYLYSSLAGDIANHSLLGAGGSGDIVFGGKISGAGQFEKFGDGNLSLTGANTFTGTTAINGGTLTLDSAGGLGASGTLSFGGGTLKHSAQNTTDHSSRFITAAGQAYSIDTNGQNVSWSTAFTGVGGSLAKLGDGNLSLNAANAFSGGITINGGKLALSNAGSIGTTGDIVFSGGTLQYSANNDTDYSSRFSNTVAQAYSVDTNGRDVTWAADLNPRNIVSLDGSLTKTGRAIFYL